MLGLDVFEKIYHMLDRVNPLPYDCGKLCDAVCCKTDSFNGEEPYLYLLPGEKEYLESAGTDMKIFKEPREEHYLPESYGDYVYVMHCKGPESCNRRLRPIQCRSFPLTPRITDEGELLLTPYYDELPYICPLISEKLELSEDFIRTTFKAWEILAGDKAIKDMILMDSKNTG